MNLVAAIAVGVLIGAGIHLMVRRDTIELALGSMLVTNAAVLLLICAGFGGHAEPVVSNVGKELADPLVQALALTAVVIGFGTSVILLRVVLAVAHSHDTIDLEDLVAIECAAESERDEPDESEADA